jgi:catecholate siderophore receptor
MAMKKNRRKARSKNGQRSRERSGSQFVMVSALMASAAFSGKLAAPLHASERLGADGPARSLIGVIHGQDRWWTRPSWQLELEALRSGAPPLPRDAIAALRLAQTQTGGAQGDTSYSFAVPAGMLEDVLAAFKQVTSLEISLSDAGINTLQSPGVSGVFTAQQALERILEGTGVVFRLGEGTAVLTIRGQSEFVEVAGSLTPTPVTSPKLNAPLRDIPQTVTVIPSDVIHAQGATTLRDVLRNVPGVTFQAGEGGGGLPGDTFTLRGFSAGSDLFIDGVRDAGGYTRDAFNIEQVEVIKGPSSAIAGRGSTGGAVNQVTKTPRLAPSQSATLGGGNAGYKRGTVDINRPLEQLGDGAALRLNGMWTDSGVPGRDVVVNKSWGLAPSLALGLTSPTRVTLKYQHLTQDNVPDYGLPWGASEGFPTGAFQATPPIDQSNFYGLRDYDFEDIRSDVGTADVLANLNNRVTLRNVTRYSETSRDSAITAPRPPNRQLQRRTMSNENLANQTNLTLQAGAGRVQHELVTGLELSRERTDNRNSAQATNQPQISIVSPDPADRPFGNMPENSGNPSRTRLNQVGAYAFETLKVGDRWQFTGGARWDQVDVDYNLTTLATGDATHIEASDDMVSWRGGAIYKPRPNGSVYVGFGTSFNPAVDAAATGAALSTAENAANNPNLAPEETRNFEVGTKWDVAGERLSLNGAVFRTEKVNARTRNANSDPFVLSGRLRVSGVEVGVSGNLTSNWNTLLAYAYMDSEIEASANPAEEGQNLTLTPKSTFSLWTSYRFWRKLTAGGGAQFMDSVFRNTTNTTSVPSYWLFSGLAQYDVNEHLSLRVNAQNLTDTQYVDRVGGGHYIPGPRRQITLNTDITF